MAKCSLEQLPISFCVTTWVPLSADCAATTKVPEGHVEKLWSAQILWVFPICMNKSRRATLSVTFRCGGEGFLDWHHKLFHEDNMVPIKGNPNINVIRSIS